MQIYRYTVTLSLLIIMTMMWIPFVLATETDKPQNDSQTEAAVSVQTEQNASLEQVAARFTGDIKFNDVEAILEALSGFDDARVIDILKVYERGRLHYVSETKELVDAESVGSNYKVTGIFSGKVTTLADKESLTKVKYKTTLRSKANYYIYVIQLKSPRDDVRQNAVYELIEKIDSKKMAIIDQYLKDEKDADIIELQQIGHALLDLDAEEKETRLAAIKTLSGSLIPTVKNKLVEVRDNKDEAPEVRGSAKSVVSQIESRVSFFGNLRLIIEGLSTGSILILIATGLAITFGVLRVINMAHGELMMIGVYVTYVVQQVVPVNVSIFIAIPLAFFVTGLLGIIIERTIVRHLRGRPLDTLLATFGVGLILQQLIRSIFGAQPVTVSSPDFMSGKLDINPVFALTYNRLYIFIFTIMVIVSLILILKKTKLGLQVRAVSSNRPIARAMGIRSEWVDSFTFALGAGIAGMAGVALSQIDIAVPEVGQKYIIDSFMVVVFGGVGSLSGTFSAGLILGVLIKFLESWYGAVVAKILVLIFIILFIQKRPRGLFPQKGRAAES